MNKLPFEPLPGDALDVENPAPGIYVDVPIQQYVAARAISRSDVGAYRKHPAYFGVHKESTPAMIYGSQYHAFVLEPDLFRDYYVQGPEAKRSAADKKWHAELIKTVGEERIYRPQELALMHAMHKALREKFIEAYAVLMSAPIFELTVIFFDPEFEMLFKIRIDSPSFELGSIVDLKTYAMNDFKLPYAVQDFAPDQKREAYIQYYCAEYDVDLQQEIYLRGCQFTPGLESLTSFIGVFQEKSDIYFTDYFDLSAFRDRTQQDIHRLLPELKEFIKGGCHIPRTGLRSLSASPLDYY